MIPRWFSRLSLLWKILLSTSVAVTLLFALTGEIVLTHITRTMSDSLNQEVSTSFQAYQSLWTSRAALLSSVSSILSTLPEVRLEGVVVRVSLGIKFAQANSGGERIDLEVVDWI